MEAERILDKIMLYFSVVNYSELAKKIGVAQQNISKWKSRNSVNAIKKKCRELGIYNDIFVVQKEDKNMNNILINGILLEQAKEKASQYGLSINAYLEFLIVQNLK